MLVSIQYVTYMCLHLVVVDRVDQPINISRSWMLYNNYLVGGNNFGMCGVRGRIFHESEVVFNALFGTVFEGNRNLGVLLVYPRR